MRSAPNKVYTRQVGKGKTGMALNLKGKTILLVDDEMFSRTTVARLLDDMGKPTIIHAVDGDEALEALSSGKFKIDMVISDFNMPGKHGLDLLRSVRMGEANINRTMPFALLTGYGDKHLVDLALALDVSAFLVKPASKNALEARLGKMLRQLPSERSMKSEDDYQDIEVGPALEEIMGFRKVTTGKPKARGVIVMKKDKPLMQGPMGPDVSGTAEPEAPEPEDESSSADTPTPSEMPGTEAPVPAETANKTAQTGGVECPLDDVPKGAVLARDVHTADGRLFMNAGYAVSPRILSILLDLQNLGHPVDSIWIEN